MPPNRSEWDVTTVILAIVVFSLSLTLLAPNYSVWDSLPKIQVTRYFVIYQNVTWTELNAILISLLLFFFCLYLEIGKRKLNEIVENVFHVSRATEAALEAEHGRQGAAFKACVELLDASAEHYENLILFRDDLRKHNNLKLQYPPTIEPSSSILYN